MKRLFLVVVAGCASGTGSNAPIDSNGGQDAPGIDGSLTDAAPQIDAAPNVDAAPNIDAAPPIDAPPDACVPMVTELLGNPNFDNAALTPWTEVRFDATVALVGAFSVAAQSGTKYTWLGGYPSSADDYVYQDFVVPALTSQVVVSGYMRINTVDSFPNADETFVGFLFPPAFTTAPIIIVNKTNSDAASFVNWTPFSQTILTPMSGQTVRFQMESVSDFIDRSNFLYDSVSVRATHGCP